MTDSSSTQFPASPKLPGQKIPPKQSEERRDVRLERIPDSIRQLETRLKIRGEVIRENRDGSVTIKTERGNVDVRPANDQPPPKQGQRVEIEIQPGKPPQQATIKPTREQTVQATPEQTTTEQARITNTPVDVEVRQTQTAKPPTINPQQALINSGAQIQNLPEAGAVVQLQPLSAKEALSFISQTTNAQSVIETTVNQTIQQTNFSAQIITIEANAELLKSTLNVATKSPEVSPEILQRAQAPSTEILNAPLLEQPAVFKAIVTQQVQTQPTQVEFTAPQETKNPVLKFFKLSILSPAQNALQALPTQIPNPDPVQIPLPTTKIEPGQFVQTAQIDLPLKAINFEQPLTIRIEQVTGPKLQFVALSETKTPLPEFLKTEVGELKTPPPVQGKDIKVDLKTHESLRPITQQQSATTLQAFVTGVTPENLPVLSLFSPQSNSVHHFALQVPVSEVTPGTEVQITPLPASTTAGITSNTALLSPFLTPGSWPALQDAYQTLAQSNPAIAQVISNVTPNASTPAQITPAAMFFIAAARGGDIGSWLGEKTIDALRRSDRGNILSRLAQDGGLLSRLSAEPVSPEWRAITLPMFSEGEMQKMALFYRHEEGRADQEDQKGKQTRFVFDLNLSQMGPVQLDGLFRETRLDVVLRTEQHFNQHMQSEMRQLYASALRDTQITGELSFQSSPEAWVHINVEEDHESNVVV